MSPEATPVQPAVLLTIIGETVLKDRIVQLLKSHSVSGYTINQVQGEGSRADGWEIWQATTPILKLRPLCHQKYLMLSSAP